VNPFRIVRDDREAVWRDANGRPLYIDDEVVVLSDPARQMRRMGKVARLTAQRVGVYIDTRFTDGIRTS
jgi:hypothetical protein